RRLIAAVSVLSSGPRQDRRMRVLVFTLLLALALPGTARSGERRPPEGVMPIGQMLRLLQERLGGGEIVEIELDDDDDGLVYEVYYVDARGRRVEIEVDARTGEILKQEVDD